MFDYFTVAQSKILNTIVYCYAESLDINLFNETLARKDLRKEATSFRQLVDWAYAAAMSDQEKNIVSNQDLQSMLNEVTITSNDQNPAESNMADFKVCDTNHQGVSDKGSTTQTNGGSKTDNTANTHHVKTVSEYQVWDIANHSMATSALHEATETKPIRSAVNSNTVDLREAFRWRGAEKSANEKTSIAQTADNHVIVNTTGIHHYNIGLSNQHHHKNTKPADAIDLNMPVVEQEVLRKDWASLADQNFYEGTLPDCQKIALVAIIDYVKRKGVVIGSDSEIYRWLYHTVSNHQRYYSRAKNFKHLANILIKQLMLKRFERPNGFNAWEQRINQQQGRGMSRLQRE